MEEANNRLDFYMGHCNKQSISRAGSATYRNHKTGPYQFYEVAPKKHSKFLSTGLPQHPLFQQAKPTPTALLGQELPAIQQNEQHHHAPVWVWNSFLTSCIQANQEQSLNVSM